MSVLQDTTGPLIQILKNTQQRKIVVTTHHKPDGDAMGSSLALTLYLKSLGHDVHFISPTDYPSFLHWMPGHNDVIIYDFEKDRAVELTRQAEYIFCLDFNDLKRIYEYGDYVATADASLVMIDHHREPSGFDSFRLWTYEASSTSELIFRFIHNAGDDDLITPQIADCLYTGMMTDTGSFRYRGTSSETHRIIASLIDKGARNSLIHELVYDSSSLMRLRMMGYVLYEKLEIIEEYNTALIYLSRDELAKYDVKTGDTEGFVNFGLSIDGIKLSVLIIDRTKLVKLSFRSKGDFSCNEFAKLHFEGGGHKNAAGGQSTDSLENTVSRFKAVLRNYEKDLA